MTTTTYDVASTYFSAWRASDFDTLRAVLAADVDFVGPMGTVAGVDDCVAGLQGVRGMVNDIQVVKIWTDGPDAITWSELHPADKDPVPTVNWSHVENGRISSIRVAFDPRPLLPPQD